MAKNIKTTKEPSETKKNELTPRQTRARLIKNNKEKPHSSEIGTGGSSQDAESSAYVVPSSPQDLNVHIASHAYDLYQRRGGHHGQDLDNWLKAEGHILSESN